MSLLSKLYAAKILNHNQVAGTRPRISGNYTVVIYNRLTRQVVTVGNFHWKTTAQHWARDTIARRAWRNASELPDDWDREQERNAAQ